MKRKCYIHFENKPTFPELDKFFQHCLQYEPVLSTSYYFVIDSDSMDVPLKDFVRNFFSRYSYALLVVSSSAVNRESQYIKTDLGT